MILTTILSADLLSNCTKRLEEGSCTRYQIIFVCKNDENEEKEEEEKWKKNKNMFYFAEIVNKDVLVDIGECPYELKQWKQIPQLTAAADDDDDDDDTDTVDCEPISPRKFNYLPCDYRQALSLAAEALKRNNKENVPISKVVGATIQATPPNWGNTMFRILFEVDDHTTHKTGFFYFTKILSTKERISLDHLQSEQPSLVRY